MHRSAAFVCGLLAIPLSIGPGSEAAVAEPGGDVSVYASTDAPGPAFSVPQSDLANSLHCSDDLAGAAREPVLLVPGTTITPDEHYDWNYMPALDAVDWPWCAVATPTYATGDMQVAAEYVVYAIRTMYERSGRRIAVLGGSQGGSLPRWALRFWPDTRAMVEDHIGLAATNHGGSGIALYSAPDSLGSFAPAPVSPPSTVGCMPAMLQQLYQSQFAQAMNSGQETFPGVSYTEISSHQDPITTPSDVSLAGGGGRITNVTVDDVCPGHLGDHFKVASYDAVGYALAIDAMTHDGPADQARLDPSVCMQEVPPGVDPAVLYTGLAKVYATFAERMATVARVPEEPPLHCYVSASCATGPSGG